MSGDEVLKEDSTEEVRIAFLHRAQMEVSTIKMGGKGSLYGVYERYG